MAFGFLETPRIDLDFSARGGGTRDKRGTNKNGVIEKAGDGRRMGGGGVSGLTGGAGG